MNSVESLDISSIGDQITVSEHSIKIIEEKTDIWESFGFFNEAENSDYLIVGPSKIFHHHLRGFISDHRWKMIKEKKRKHEKLTTVVTLPQMITCYKKKSQSHITGICKWKISFMSSYFYCIFYNVLLLLLHIMILFLFHYHIW